MRLTIVLLLGIVAVSNSNFPAGEELERIRAFSRPLEFDYVSWMLQAIGVKLDQIATGADRYIPAEEEYRLVLDYLDLIGRIQQAEAHLFDIYADPQVLNPQNASALVRQQLATLVRRRAQLAPLVESILQGQISETAADLGLALGGQPVPPVLYHSTPLPTALIISPRNRIQQDYNISLLPELTADERAALEEQVDKELNVSSLVVDIGGIGVYPTMVMQTTDLNSLTEVVAHEWIHNFLALRPLGMSYLESSELRTMNETAASIAGKEVGLALIARYYPERLPSPPPPSPPAEQKDEPPPAPVFDFRAEMRTTRLRVDTLLEEGKIEEAEAYMEERRVFFWENGYHLRKLNQAYFAFHGAYADEPGGAAGDDPVGAAVRALRASSPSLVDFLNRISWMTSFEQLRKATEGR
jgi:hypothetical protein